MLVVKKQTGNCSGFSKGWGFCAACTARWREEVQIEKFIKKRHYFGPSAFFISFLSSDRFCTFVYHHMLCSNNALIIKINWKNPVKFDCDSIVFDNRIAII